MRLALAVLTTLLTLTAADRDTATKASLDPAQLAKIPKRLREFVDSGKAAGMVTLVARHGQVAALDAIGYTDFDTKQPIKTDAIFQLHSMTKPMVCLGVLMLAEDGKLTINDPIEKHLPEFRGQMVLTEDGKLVKPSRLVTIRDLMTHTSGMILNPPAAIGELHGALHKSLADVVLIESQQPLLFQPGTKWSYSNTGIAALARLIEVHSGMAFEKFLESRLFQPLGMVDSYIFPPKDKHHRMPTAYLLKDGQTIKYTSDPLGEGVMKFRVGAKYSLPEGGVYSTASDLFRLYQMMLNGGTLDGKRVISKASLQLMTSCHTPHGMRTSMPGGCWGLGSYVITDPAQNGLLLSEGTHGHGGRYGTFYAVDPKRDMISIFLIHREGGSDERNAFLQIAAAAVLE
jgi:CubicO group peptidase (beta-lactamase class C family)